MIKLTLLLDFLQMFVFIAWFIMLHFFYMRSVNVHRIRSFVFFVCLFVKCTWELLIHKEWITTVENMCSFLVGVVFTAYLARAVIFAKVLYALLWCDDIQEGTHLSFMQQEDECCASFSCFRLWKGAPASHDWGSEFKKGVIKDKELKHSLRSRSCGKADPGRCLHKCAQLLLSHHTGSLKKKTQKFTDVNDYYSSRLCCKTIALIKWCAEKTCSVIMVEVHLLSFLFQLEILDGPYVCTSNIQAIIIIVPQFANKKGNWSLFLLLLKLSGYTEALHTYSNKSLHLFHG